MKIVSFNTFEGRNIYAHKKCIRMDLNLDGYADIPSCDIESFNEKLLQFIPELYEHSCGINEKNGFVKRLQEGTYLAHICEHSILAIENKLGLDVSYGKAREIEGQRYYVIYEYEYKNTGMEVGKAAVELINAIIQGKGFNLDLRLSEIKDILRKEQLGASTLAICNAAKERGIPVKRIGDGSLIQLGYGKFAKRIEATIGCNTSCLSVDAACDKLLTKEILHTQCIPVVIGGKVRNVIDLLLEAESIGYPVVLKPRYGNQGKGVILNIKNERELMKAYTSLTKTYNEIMIEKYLHGRDYRVCIVDGNVVAVAERIPPYVIGDGTKTIGELIEEVNKEELRGDGHEKALTKIKIDDELRLCIEDAGYKIYDILPKNNKLTVRKNANLSTGGMAIDCTDFICKENIEICVRAANAIGLDICGLDICCEDISKPLKDEGAIIEINAAPGIRMHHYPYMGSTRDVAGTIVDMLFKNSSTSIPIVSITGTNGKTTTTRLINHVLSLAGFNVGMTTTGGIYINNKCIAKGDTTGPKSALTVLLNKEVDAAVLETARGGILRSGVVYDLADVGVITNITEDHLGIDGIDNMEDLAFVKALVGEAVKADGYVVLNADDKLIPTIMDRMKSKVILFSKSRNNPLLEKNLQCGGIIIYTDDKKMYIENKEDVISVIKIEDIQITIRGKLIYNIENAMAACGALVGLGIDLEVIRKGISSFYGDDKHNPGRFNMYAVNGATVIIDYGHNIEGYKAVIEGAKKIEHNRFIGIIGVPGDRLDSNVLEIGKISGQYFDYLYIKEDEDKRGRKVGDIAKILEKGALASKFEKRNMEIILDEKSALEKALEVSRAGDLIIVFFEKYEGLVKVVEQKQKEGKQHLG